MDATSHTPAEELITVTDLERITKIKRNTLYRMALDRRIPSYKVGKIRRFKLSDVMTALESCRVEARPSR